MKGWTASTERKYVWVIGFKCYQNDIAAWVVSPKHRSSHGYECISGLVPSPVSPCSFLSLTQMSLAYAPFQPNHRPIEDTHAFGNFSLVEKAVAMSQYKPCFSVYVSAAAILSHVSGCETST
ncbi:hypothetical protein RSOLAG1IB_10705 [Rhizoctonia solani AG-1 IB]|uniref:Uncharacterized protein n=1 Tax=Thanatephorus cucumeris (strain AG1-IB / isolate 7/3/14) TaxID=1108050 RepID=A0A0B7G2N0_THACB|nr:hypothetical protein RSOLAG1IB_10705 [Rhizoctonia solani AG-1 IB]